MTFQEAAAELRAALAELQHAIPNALFRPIVDWITRHRTPSQETER